MAENIDQKEANKALYIAGAVIVLLIMGLFTNGFGLFNKNPEPPVQPQKNNQNSDEFVKLEVGDAPTLGAKDAKVIIYEFSDFSCPACAMAAGTTKDNDKNWVAPLPEIKKKYVDTGKALLVFKYFPGHGTGNSAHLVGWCVNEQDSALFWKFHDIAFIEQEKTGNIAAMKEIAGSLGADVSLLDACISSGKYQSLLQKDKAMGLSNGVQGTPGFFINGKLITGAQSAEVFEKAIEKELAK